VNILQLYPKSDFFTGAAIQLRDLALGLAGRGHHVVVATRPNEHWGRACAAANVEHAAVPMRSGIDLPSAWALARLIREHEIEIVHCQKGRARTLAMLAGLTVRIPVLVLNRGVSFPLDRWNRLDKRIQTFMLAQMKTYEDKMWTTLKKATSEADNCNTGKQPCTMGKMANITIIPVKPAEAEQHKKLVETGVLAGWAKRCGAECTREWNDTVGKALNLRAPVQ